MTMPAVFGLLGDRGWIIEQLARDIAASCPNFAFGTRITGRPDIVYYMTYATRRTSYDGIEVGYFTHIEEGLPAEQLFYDVAGQVDHCVTQATRYERVLRARGITAVTTIPPGIDHDEFFPRLRIGVVGRTYHTGRKGEALVAQLMDMDQVEFLFTGDGWPGPPIQVPPGGMGDFYRSLDYLLVPALHEGGPMSVPEAIACGTPVIAPTDVGWIEDFPHIPFPRGDADALRRVLTGLAVERQALAQAARDYTARAWGDAHGTLFDRLWSARGRTPRTAPTGLSRARVLQVMHGGEQRSKGGPTVRVPHTADLLAPHCAASDLHFGAPPPHARADIAHFYNIWQPNTALALCDALAGVARLRVFSPILLDLSLRPFWETALMREVESAPTTGPERVAAILPRLQDLHARACAMQPLARRGYQPTPGFSARLAEIARRVDLTVFLSTFERDLATALGVQPRRHAVLHNPVDCSFFAPAGLALDETEAPPGPAPDPDLDDRMHALTGLPPGTPFLLAVGRIEVRKNQLAMAEIARRADLPLVIAGHEGARAYADAVRDVLGDRLHLVGRVDPCSPELRWLYRACAAFLSLSWAEGASLAALEAAATGAPLLLSDTSSEREYFDGMAEFCGPLDIDGALQALPRALASGAQADRLARHRRCVQDYDWPVHIARLCTLYEDLLAGSGAS